MKLSDFDYHLPRELIAQAPAENRDESKLMIFDGKSIKHEIFRNIVNYLDEGDTLILNNTKVIPARLYARKNTGGGVELLLLKSMEENCWESLIKGRVKEHSTLTVGSSKEEIRIKERIEGGRFKVEFLTRSPEEVIKKFGVMPTPPYIKGKLKDQERYQTVYARVQGSVAAPTAGLHFTDSLLSKIRRRGIRIAYITLHLGFGTFAPVKAEKISEHRMESEYYHIDERNAEIINRCEGRNIAVGTSVVKTLESACSENGMVNPSEGWSNLFIYPPYEFKFKIDCLLTNFHLPKSTLLMLVSAFIGRERILRAYREAVKHRYRFYSFGDAMFIAKGERDG